MDLFYYWKDFVTDVRANRIHSLGSNHERIAEIVARRHPDRVWVFKTPDGKKPQIQVLGCMVVTNNAPSGFIPTKPHNVFYDPESSKSVLFTNSGTDERLKEITDLFNNRYQAAFRANFQGVNGVQEIEMDAVTRLTNITRRYSSVQFMDGIKAHRKPQAA